MLAAGAGYSVGKTSITSYLSSSMDNILDALLLLHTSSNLVTPPPYSLDLSRLWLISLRIKGSVFSGLVGLTYSSVTNFC